MSNAQMCARCQGRRLIRVTPQVVGICPLCRGAGTKAAVVVQDVDGDFVSRIGPLTLAQARQLRDALTAYLEVWHGSAEHAASDLLPGCSAPADSGAHGGV